MKRIAAVILVLCLLIPCAFADGLETIENRTLGLSVQYPVGWTANPGTATLCYLEPSTNGNAGRMAVTVKTVTKTMTTKRLKEQMTSLSESIATLYNDFEMVEYSDSSKFLNTRAYSMTYIGETDAQSYKGFVTLTNIGKKLYVFHYSCREDDYDANIELIQQLRDGVQPLSE